MSGPDVLFKGVIRAAGRDFTLQTLRAVQPAKVIIPCTGSFSLAATVVEAGVPPEAIVCGDISLYSTALGFAFNRDIFRLEAKADSPYAELVAPFMDDPVSRAAAVLLMIRIFQFSPLGKSRRGPYYEQRKNELIRRFPEYIEQLCTSIFGGGEILEGMTYLSQDMKLTIAQHIGDPETVLLFDPPWYKGGYDRMFAGIETVFDWDEPEITPFDKDDYGGFLSELGDSDSLSLVYYASDGTDPADEWGTPWRGIFAERIRNKGASAVHWIIGNRTPSEIGITRKKTVNLKAAYPQFDGEVTPDSKIWAEHVKQEVGDYYRDLWIHRLSGGTAETYVALIIDGAIFGIVGTLLADMYRGRILDNADGTKTEHYATVTFAFNAPHPVYRRTQRLLLKTLTASWFWDDFSIGDYWMALHGIPRFVKTAMLLRYPKAKAMRGIMQLRTSKATEDDTYHLVYEAPIEIQTRKDTLEWWLKKHSQQTLKSNPS